MKMIRVLLLAFVLTACSAFAFAGDYADFKFIGFSADGKYLAFEESGEYDGSGGEYATTYYVDVEANKYALPPTAYEWGMDAMKESLQAPRLQRYKIGVAAAIRKLRIVRGNTGKQVVAHLLNDWSFVEPGQREYYFIDPDGTHKNKLVTDYTGGMIRRGADTEKVIFNPDLWAYTQNTTDFYEVTLTSSETNSGEGCSEGLRFEMMLKDATHHQDLPIQTLQKDGATIPGRRDCPYGYHIEQVFYYKDRVAVFVNMFSQGFEGPDMRYMAVTGELEYEANGPG